MRYKKNKLESSDFGQNYWSRTAFVIFKNGHDSIRSMKWIWDYDRSYYENINYYDLMGSVCKYLNEIPQWTILCRSKGSSK